MIIQINPNPETDHEKHATRITLTLKNDTITPVNLTNVKLCPRNNIRDEYDIMVVKSNNPERSNSVCLKYGEQVSFTLLYDQLIAGEKEELIISVENNGNPIGKRKYQYSCVQNNEHIISPLD